MIYIGFKLAILILLYSKNKNHIDGFRRSYLNRLFLIMKKINSINLSIALCLSVLVFSCGPKKQIGFFSNTSDRYEVKHSPIADPNKSDLGAMAEGSIDVEASSFEAVSDAQVEQNISTVPAPKAEKIESKVTTAPAVEAAPLKEIPRKITKEQKKEIKKALEVGAADTNTLLLVIIAILIPPVAVALVDGLGSGPFWLSILLWLLFYVPGLIYALWRIFRKK